MTRWVYRVERSQLFGTYVYHVTRMPAEGGWARPQVLHRDGGWRPLAKMTSDGYWPEHVARAACATLTAAEEGDR